MMFDPFDPSIWHWLGLTALFSMCFVAVSPLPIPLPITITLLWLARTEPPVALILVTTVGTVAGWYFLENTFRRWIAGPKVQNAIPQSYQQFFMRHSVFWMFFFNALPFPWDPMRLLVLLNNYPRGRFLCILAITRLIRNTIIVTLGILLAPYKLLFWGVLLLFLALPPIVNRLMRWTFKRFPKPSESPSA